MDHKNPTIKDVALRAGVSVSAVSRALNGGYASSDTQQRVREACQALGYRPHAAARSLKLQQNQTVGLMVADITNSHSAALADGVLSAARLAGYHVIVCATDEDPDLEQEYLNVLMEQRVAGVIAVPTGHNLGVWRIAKERGVTVVFIDRELPGVADIGAVLVDNHGGAREAVRHLLAHGHRRIGLIGGPLHTTTGKGRYEGYVAALREARLSVDPGLLRLGSFRVDSGQHLAKSLLERPDPPSALFAVNNKLGEGAYRAIRAMGLRVPQDVSLVVFDDPHWCALADPGIDVLVQPTREMGTMALNLLLDTLRGEERSGRRVVFPATLQIRQSTGKVVVAEPR